MKSALILDDSKAMRMILRKIMAELGFEVKEASNGVEGMDLLEKEGVVDLALVDWNMPEMNGFEFIMAVRSRNEYKKMRLVVVSSESQAQNMERMFEAGADEYVTKPFTRELLRKKLELIGLIGEGPHA
jgi:two-component system chemotaxis response regulator CheY